MWLRQTLHTSNEHNESYYEQFLPFSETVHTVSHAMCGAVCRPRANGLRSLMGLWQNGSIPWVIRLFIDFCVPQKIILCYQLDLTRADAASFVSNSLRLINAKLSDPTLQILKACVTMPIVFVHSALWLQNSANGDDSGKLPAIEVTRYVFFGDSHGSVVALISHGVLTSLVELARDSAYRALLVDSLDAGSVLTFQFLRCSDQLRPFHLLLTSGISA
jgi:hypothetical protein